MASDGSRTAVAMAIGGNSLVMVAKFVAFAMTGSGAMLSEAIHTTADVFNQILLMVGIVRSERPADRSYRYGYGQERFVWALISAVGIFFLGCGVTIYHGISSLMHPHPVGGLAWSISVLAFALVVDGVVFVVAWRQLSAAADGEPFWEYLNERADPSAVAVLLEDFAACIGVLIAVTCILLAHVTGQVWWDAVGSILIGVLLGVVAIWLIARNRELLVGRALPESREARLEAVIRGTGAVERVVRLKTRSIGNDSYDVMLELDFDGEAIAQRLEPRIQAAWAEIENYEAFRAFAGRFADDVIEALGDEIDDMEADIRAALPEATHIDIEPD
jgi:solute carrier family 30 (zinc transporter), member 9